MKRKLKVLFYGVTHEHGPGKLETLKRLKDDYEVVAVVDDRKTTGEQFQIETFDFSGMNVVEESAADVEALAKDVDVAFVEVANGRLMEIAEKFVGLGIPMHCDKPCGESMEPYRALVGKCRAADVPFQIGYMYRGNPAIRWIWDFVANGGLGEVSFVEADMNHDYGYPADAYARYLSQFRGGIFYNLGCHLVDAVFPLVKDRAFEGAEMALDAAPGYPEDSRTRAFSTLRFGGARVVLRTSCGMGGGNLARRLRVDGSKGTIDLCPIERFDGKELMLILSLKGEEPKEMSFGVQTDRYAVQLLDLARIVRGEKANDQYYDRDLKVHEILIDTISSCCKRKTDK